MELIEREAGVAHPPEDRLEQVAPPWQTLLLVCTKCKGARHGPDARDVRKGIKHRLGKSKSLRVLEADCLDICPEHALAVCLVREGRGAEVCILRDAADLDALAARLGRR